VPRVVEEIPLAPGAEHFSLPSIDLLEDPVPYDEARLYRVVKEKAEILSRTLEEFGVNAKVVNVETGPVVTQYELELGPGVKVGKVLSLNDDISIALKGPVRIVAPIPGKSTVGVEVPNSETTHVRLKEIIGQGGSAQMSIPLFLGKDVLGNALISDLTEMPHLLIAGQTGSGKSVCLNSIILSILMTRTPEQVNFLLVDPKMVELSVFRGIPHLIAPVVTDMKRAATILEWACEKMDERYALLSCTGVRNIKRYNSLSREEVIQRLSDRGEEDVEDLEYPLPYLILIVDELADMMMISAKEVENSVTRLAQKSRAVGIHLVLATQRPSVDVITGLIKSNMTCRTSFQVASKVDSRTILDQNGAEKLLGCGDMLFMAPGTAKLLRAQGTFVSDEEVKSITQHLKDVQEPSYSQELIKYDGPTAAKSEEQDPLFEQAVRIILESQRGSVSLLQRRLEIGYSRASRLVEMMAQGGLLGTYKGSQARKVLMSLEEWEERQGNTVAANEGGTD